MFKYLILKVVNAMGFDVLRINSFSIEKGGEFLKAYKMTKKYSSTSIERMFSLYKSIEYITKYNIPGDIVECGVWKGGSMMLCALALNLMGDNKRRLFLYDTYKGMVEPGEEDISFLNYKMKDRWMGLNRKDHNDWLYAPLSEVKENMYSTGYPKEKILFIEGKVEETIPNYMPDRIALLRLDTDWFNSTYHELVNLYPLLSPHGVIQIDDYGMNLGQKKAVDKYFTENNLKIFLNRTDCYGVIGVRPD